MLSSHQNFSLSLKRKVKEICGYACVICGRNEQERLQVHHIENRGMGGDRSKNTTENLILLCNLCHRRVTTGDVKILRWEPDDPELPTQLMLAEMYDGVPSVVHYTRLGWYRRKPNCDAARGG